MRGTFWDKTPPYYLIADEIVSLFPDAKYVFLWRNPLSTLASVIGWQPGGWDYRFGTGHLLDSPRALHDLYESGRCDGYALGYEDFIRDGGEAWTGLLDHLGLERIDPPGKPIWPSCRAEWAIASRLSAGPWIPCRSSAGRRS